MKPSILVNNISHSLLKNILYCRLKNPHSMLFYIVESANWSIKWDGSYITMNLNDQRLLKARITLTHKGICNQIIHFGSVNTFPAIRGVSIKDKLNNKVILTWFHLIPDDPRIEIIRNLHEHIDVIHTSCNITREKLIGIGIPKDKIVVIPLGVDLNLFKPVSSEEKQKIRDRLGIPKDKIVIGSFQKDGIGWGEGLEPKWVKGSDIFIEVIAKIKKSYDIFILLTGPARGYVKRELERLNVPYRHFFLKDYLEIPKYYHALDLYLITSRAEGGPKAILESMATGIPIVSTKVGMAPDIMKDWYNGLLAEVDDVAMLSEKAERIIADKKLVDQLTSNGLNTVKDYSWRDIAKQYYKKIYKRFFS